MYVIFLHILHSFNFVVLYPFNTEETGMPKKSHKNISKKKTVPLASEKIQNTNMKIYYSPH